MQIDERGEGGDEDREWHEHRDDGEGEAEKSAHRHPQRHRGPERQDEREKRAHRSVEQEGRPDDQGAEEGKVPDGSRAGLALEPGLHVRGPDAPDGLRARAGERGIDRGQGRVALRRIVHVEVHDDGEEPVAEKSLLAEELRPGRELPQLRWGRAGTRLAQRIEHGERAEVRLLP